MIFVRAAVMFSLVSRSITKAAYNLVIYISFYYKKKQRQRVLCRLVSCIKETHLIPIFFQQSSHMIALINKHEAFRW